MSPDFWGPWATSDLRYYPDIDRLMMQAHTHARPILGWCMVSMMAAGALIQTRFWWAAAVPVVVVLYCLWRLIAWVIPT